MKKRDALHCVYFIFLALIVLFVSYAANAMDYPVEGQGTGEGGNLEDQFLNTDNYFGTSVLELGSGYACVRFKEGQTPILSFPVFKKYTVADYGALSDVLNGLDEYNINPAYSYPSDDGYWDSKSGTEFEITLPVNETGDVAIRYDKKNIKNFLFENKCYLYVKGEHYVYNDVTEGPSEPVVGSPYTLQKAKDCESKSICDLKSDTCGGTKPNCGNTQAVLYNLQPTEGIPFYEEYLSGYFKVNEQSNDFKYEVNWDKDNPTCIGSHIRLDNQETDPGETKISDLWGYGPEGKESLVNNDECCGDDYLWIMNGAYGYTGEIGKKTVDDLCLYSYPDVSYTSGNVGNHPYRKVYCTHPYELKPDIHYAYDSYISDYNPTAENNKMTLFQLKGGEPLTTTDVGMRFISIPEKDDAPLFCHHYFNTEGDQFDWLFGQVAAEINYFDVGNTNGYNKENIPEVVDNKFILNPKAPDYIYDVIAKNPKTYYGEKFAEYDKDTDTKLNSDELTICNLFLGGEWTGHHCCGGKYDYTNKKKIQESFNDVAPASTGKDAGTHYVLDSSRMYAYSLDADTTKQGISIQPNKACYQGEAIGQGEIKNLNSAPEEVYSFKDVAFYKENEQFYCDLFGANGKPTYLNSKRYLFPNNTIDKEWCCKQQYGANYTNQPNSDIILPTFTGSQCYYYKFFSQSLLNEQGKLKLCTNLNLNDADYFKSFGYKYDFVNFVDTSDLNNPLDSNLLFNFNNLKENDFGKDDGVFNHCEFTIIPQSEYIKSLKDNDKFYYCFTNNTWLSFDILEQPYEKGQNPEFDILGRYPTAEELKAGDILEPSKAPDALVDKTKGETSTGCCFKKDGCWDGSKCVKNGKTIEKNLESGKTVFLCANGVWKEGAASYDWYGYGKGEEDVEGLQYCIEPWSCSCPDAESYSLSESDPDYNEISVCETYTDKNTACTRESAMFIGDRFCEPAYENNDFKTPKDANWSTRTKYLATAMLKFAEATSPTDFVLHCDTPDKILNYYHLELAKDVFVDENDYNNFCVLQLGSDEQKKVYIGTTLNPMLNYEDIPEEVYSETEEGFTELPCETDEDCFEGWGCYMPVGKLKGECMMECEYQSQCFDDETCYIPDDEDMGMCIKTQTASPEMLDLNLAELYYGDSDTSGILDEEFLFNMVSSELNYDACIAEISKTNVGGKDNNAANFLTFTSCLTNKNVLYNNYTKSIIFKDTDFIPEDLAKFTVSYAYFNKNALTGSAADIDTYYKTYPDKIAEKKDMSIIDSISDLSTLYYAKHGDAIIFGILERKSDPASSADSPLDKLRYFYAILYKNTGITCDSIEESAPELYCDDSDPTTVIIIGPTTPDYDAEDSDSYGAYKYWLDLTAKIRFKVGP